MYDVVTVGNALLDVSLHVSKDSPFAKLDSDKTAICFTYGEKIHVEDCTFSPGGNACNVGVSLSRLGLSVGLLAEIGDDEFAQRILGKLSKELLDTSLVLQTKGASSSFAVGVHYKGERTLFVRHVKREHNFNLNNLETKWIYLTSLGNEWKKPYTDILSFVKEKKVLLAFSPGTHQFEEEGLTTIQQVLRSTDILFVNKEEGQRISNEQEMRKLLVQLKSMGPKVVVVTDGENGSFVIDKQGKMYAIGIVKCDIIGRTGAGDAYASAFLAAILNGEEVADAMRRGAVNAAAVIEHIGAQSGLLSREQLEERLKAYSDIQAKEL